MTCCGRSSVSHPRVDAAANPNGAGPPVPYRKTLGGTPTPAVTLGLGALAVPGLRQVSG